MHINSPRIQRYNYAQFSVLSPHLRHGFLNSEASGHRIIKKNVMLHLSELLNLHSQHGQEISWWWPTSGYGTHFVHWALHVLNTPIKLLVLLFSGAFADTFATV